MRYANKTDVSVAKTRLEIEQVVTRYGADGFMSGWLGGEAQIAFQMKGRQVRINLQLPHPSDKRFAHDGNGRARTPERRGAAWEQECRQSWRVLLLAVKAKLEAVEAKISTFEEEFLAHLVIPDGKGETVGERLLVTRALDGGALPPLLGGKT
jgi:hypothetical protein